MEIYFQKFVCSNWNVIVIITFLNHFKIAHYYNSLHIHIIILCTQYQQWKPTFLFPWSRNKSFCRSRRLYLVVDKCYNIIHAFVPRCGDNIANTTIVLINSPLWIYNVYIYIFLNKPYNIRGGVSSVLSNLNLFNRDRERAFCCFSMT